MVELLVQSKVRALIKEQGLNTGGDALEAIDEKLKDLVLEACERATGNSRKTVMGRDI